MTDQDTGNQPRLVDLTVPLVDGMPAFPGEPTIGFTPFTTLDRDDVEMWRIDFFSQLGTHVDAPSHFLRGGRTIDQVDLRKGIGPCLVLDARSHIGDELGIEAFRPALEVGASRILVRTGWDARLGEDSYWAEYPAVTLDAAQALVEGGVVFLGLDTPSPHPSDFRPVHEILLGGEILLAECVIGLAELRQAEVFLFAAPLPFVGLDGSPIRLVAIDEPRERWLGLAGE
jgi:arylformamidase